MRHVTMFPYNRASEGCRELAQHLGILRIRRENSRYRGRPDKIVINWGNSSLPEEVSKSTVLNSAESVSLCSNKLAFFRYMKSTDASEFVPEATESFEEALEWVRSGKDVVARTVLNGHSGEGIVIMNNDDPDSLVRAPLYVEYIKKMEEYRVHIVNGEVIDIQRKVLSSEKRESGDEINWKIRNHDNGFIFQREGINPHESVTSAAIQVFNQTRLDFGAADVIFNRSRQRSYVLEINTAPGLQGQTVESYANALRNLIGQ